mmetsp:Transcript_26987/g.37953  ORF Transcript_26987/g.37953 Transcript_26987/m.37953 type:complete len:100 (-) Transcript_26987:407-706(-)
MILRYGGLSHAWYIQTFFVHWVKGIETKSESEKAMTRASRNLRHLPHSKIYKELLWKQIAKCNDDWCRNTHLHLQKYSKFESNREKSEEKATSNAPTWM